MDRQPAGTRISYGARRLAGRLSVLALVGVVVTAAAFPDWAADAERSQALPAAESACVPVGQWRLPEDGSLVPATSAGIVDRALAAGVVLLGESHDNAEHHRWQLQVLAALYVRQPNLLIALEMFPRRVQPTLDRWVAGELDERAFLAEADWQHVWSFDPSLYLPIFHFARMNRIPLVAVNVERGLVRKVSEQGFAAVPAAEREGVDVPAPPLRAYEDMLFDSWLAHLEDEEGAAKKRDRTDPEFLRFLESQLVWDRAMAQGIANAAAAHPGAVIAGLMGSGHLANGWGVPHQLQALGKRRPLVLLPFDPDGDCKQLTSGLADGAFGVSPPPRVAEPPRPRLGVLLRSGDGEGALIMAVTPGSLAERTGLRVGDRIVAVAGRPAEDSADVADTVRRQAPGTWLPLEVLRDGERLELVARFPADPHR
jgi:uncharacterized iron-regulated protein